MGKEEKQTGTIRKKSKLKIVLLCLFSVFILELVASIVWGLAVPKKVRKNVNALCSVTEGKSVEKLPNSFWHHDLNPEHDKYKGNVSVKGTKGADFVMPKPVGELRVICLGDSTVEGTGVESNETFPYYLEKLLEKNVDILKDNDSVKVINAGIGSHNSAFNLSYLAFRLIHYQPDVLVVKSAYNDYLPYCMPGMGYDYTHAFPNPYHRVRISGYWKFARYSRFLKMLGVVLFRNEIAIPFRDFSGHITAEQFHKMDYSENKDKFYIYGENIRSMVLLCRERNIKVFLVDLPTSPDPTHFESGKRLGTKFKDLVGKLEVELEKVANEENVPFVKTGPFVNTDFWDHCHCTADGNLKVAKAIAARMANSKHP